jgi:hypothetical protein
MLVGENKETFLKFKMPLGAVVWLLFVGNLLGFFLLFPVLVEQQRHLTVSLQKISAEIWGMTLIADILLGFICAEYFKVKLNPRGISCFNIWGIYSFVLWEEIREVKTFNFWD